MYCPNTFIFMSTNKVYGDNPNKLPLLRRKRDGNKKIINFTKELMKVCQ